MTKIAIVPNAAGTGTFTIEAPNSNSNRTLVLPDAAGELFTNAGGTLTGALTGTDLTLSGGVYLGGTGSANLLDDYEEGTWTPALFGATTAGSPTYGTRTGFYTKVGQLVVAGGRITLTNKGGMAGEIRLSGLPFISASNAQDNEMGVLRRHTGIISSLVYNVFPQNSSDNALFRSMNSASDGGFGDGDIANNTFFQVQVIYRVP
jgi:hypothetical protein